MPEKSKIFTIAVVAFIILWIVLVFKPKYGINPLLFEAKNIDSIQIYKAENKLTLKNPGDIAKVSTQLNKLIKVKPDRLKANTGFTDLYFYTKEGEIPIRIIYGYFDGIIINANDLYYKNDSLNSLIVNYLQKR